MLSDLRYGLRMLRATPRLTGAAVLSLALGIGAASAIFTVVNRVVLQPLPFDDADRLVAIWETSPESNRRPVAPANFLDWRADAQSFTHLAAFDSGSVNLTSLGPGGAALERPERLRAASVSANFFSLLGVQPMLGLPFTPALDEPGAEPSAMLTFGAWQRLFGGDQAAIGRTLTLDDRPHTVVGILPRSFDLLGSDVEVVTSGDRGVPNTLPIPADLVTVRDSHFISVVGRLRPGVSIAQGQAEISTIMRRLAQAYPDTNTGLGARVIALHDDLIADARTALLLLMGAVGCLLLIACVNVANLLLARAVTRQREMHIRLAMGAARGRLVRQMLTETALLGCAGGALGLLLGAWGVDALIALAPRELPRMAEIQVDAATLVFTAAISLGSAALFGLAPALQASGQHLTPSLQGDGVRTSDGRTHRRLQQALVVGELTLAQVLLAGAGLLIASFVNVQRVDLGFSPQRLLAVELTMPAGKYAQPERKLAFNRAVLERMQALPGVQQAAATLTVPLRGAINRGFRIDGRPEPLPGQESSVDFMIVSPEYFATVGVPIVSGRGFTAQDGPTAPRVALVSRAMARRYWPGEQPVGQRVLFGRDKVHEIVGIVGDVRQRDPALAAEPLLYIPYQQDAEPWNFITFALRVQGDPASVAAAARDAVFAVDPAQPVSRVRTIDEISDSLLAPRRFNTILLVVFSAAALLLAAIGTYGVMAYSVTRRTREIGVRVALGARPADVLRLVLGQGGRLVAIALLLGLSGAALTNRLLAAQLFEVGATDPATLAAGAATLSACAFFACYLPARRAMRLAPVEALREQ